MAVGSSLAYTVGEPMDANNKVDSGSEVIVDSIDGGQRTIDLDSAFSGTVILVNYAEYMKLSEGIWIRHSGQRKTSEDLATQIREAQKDDLSIILVHMP